MEKIQRGNDLERDGKQEDQVGEREIDRLTKDTGERK